MKKYKSHKVVEAAKIENITRVNECDIKLHFADDDSVFIGEDDKARFTKASPDDFGYLIVYEDGYQSWSPSKAFEEGYSIKEDEGGNGFMDPDEAATQKFEAVMQTKGLTAPRITAKHISDKVKDATYHVFENSCLTVCCLTLVNGFTVTGESACASPENFDAEVGEQISFKNAFNKIWMLEGYLLKECLFNEAFEECAPEGSVAQSSLYSNEEIEEIAEMCHEANASWCRQNGDDSQPSWTDAPDWQKGSAVNGVRFHLDNPKAGDSASHDNWMAEKLADGWVYGEVKDPEAKTHHCLVPFDELPVVQQRKDAIFRSIVHAMS